jgi:hypothetical protein
MPVMKNCWPLLIFTSAESGLHCTGTNFKSIYEATAGKKSRRAALCCHVVKRNNKLKPLRLNNSTTVGYKK